MKYIEYIDDYGVSRYLDYPTVIQDRSLFRLDRSIWHIRRYCYYIRAYKIEDELEMIHNDKYKKYPNKYWIPGGFLEGIIEKSGPLASFLIWKNFYYGKRKKRKVRNVRLRVSAANPTHFLYPEVINELDKLVDFPRALRNHFRSIGKLTTG